MDDKKKELYDKQVETLKILLEHRAITREQYEISLNGLTTKMGMVNTGSSDK